METDLKKIVGQRLQLLRLEKDLTQEQMGEKLNLSTSAYCKIEYGETDLTLTRLNKIADALGMPSEELFNKLNGDSNYNQCQHFIGTSHQSRTINVGIHDNSELLGLIKANSKIIDMLCKRIDMLENKFQ